MTKNNGKTMDELMAEYRSNVVVDVEMRCRFIREQVNAANRKGVIVGISGGIDSAVTAALCLKALGKENVLGVWISAHSAEVHQCDAQALAEAIGLRLIEVNLDQVTDVLLNAIQSPLQSAGLLEGSLCKLAIGNTKARERMTVLYAIANQLGYLVAGTCNYTEIYLGYETKGGDQMCDFNPVSSLVKAQIQVMADHLGIPESILCKAPSADLWEGQTDEGEMGFTYADADRILLTGQGSPEVMAKIEKLHLCSEHKRRMAPGI